MCWLNATLDLACKIFSGVINQVLSNEGVYIGTLVLASNYKRQAESSVDNDVVDLKLWATSLLRYIWLVPWIWSCDYKSTFALFTSLHYQLIPNLDWHLPLSAHYEWVCLVDNITFRKGGTTPFITIWVHAPSCLGANKGKGLHADIMIDMRKVTGDSRAYILINWVLPVQYGTYKTLYG
jgi:hypothetical protein